MEKIRAAIVGYGNIGKYVLEALEVAPDFEVAGVIRRDPTQVPAELQGIPVVDSITKLESRCSYPRYADTPSRTLCQGNLSNGYSYGR